MERNMQELEKDTLQVCQDFTAFCDYLTDNKVKLAKQTGNIGKKDCFALNALFYVREDYERPSNTQNKYPVINFFYYIAVRYRILEINFPGMTMEQGRNYQQFREASVWEQYALFLAVFLFDGRFARGESRWDEDRVAEMWDLYIDKFMEWVETEEPAAGKICQWTWKQRYQYFRCMEYIIPYLEELKLIKVWNKSAAECGEREYCLEFEALPLLETAFELYENEVIESDENAGDDGAEDVCMDSSDEDRMVRHAWEECVSRFGKGKKKGDFSRLFGNVATEGQKQMIDLEVSVRGTDCIRVIRMNLEDSLYDLHRMIQRAVSFDDDHLYEFCVGTGMMKRVYLPSDALDSGRELSVDIGLGNLDLYRGQKFTYLFDFGDMWYFDIKVLEIREGTVEEPEVIKAVGDAPEQYPFYEEAWEEWQVVISDQVQVNSILNSIEADLLREEHAALAGRKSVVQEEKSDPEMLSCEMEEFLLKNPDRMLMFMTAKMREMLSELLQSEWIDVCEKCTLAMLYSFGFCRLPEGNQCEIVVPASVEEVYSSKIKEGGKYDSITDTAELFLRRCGVMEMEALHTAVTGFLKCDISCEDFSFLIYSRLHYFGRYYSHCLQGTEYMSCYDSEITQRILGERQKPENRTFVYPDFTRIDAGESQESQNAVQDWEEYIKFHLNIDWRTAALLTERIPAMAATGVLQKEEIVAAYKEMLCGTGCRETKKAESLIGALLMNAPFASQKGNARGKDPRVKECVVREKTPVQKTSEEKASRQVKRPENTTEKGTEAEKTEAEEYKQLSIFDLAEPVAGESAGEK